MKRSVAAVLTLVCALSSGAIVFAGEPDGSLERIAVGCGMPEMPITGPAKDRLNMASNELAHGNLGRAWRVARSVTEMPDAKDDEKAQAHLVMGWILTKNHADGAQKELAQAKSLDAMTVATILAHAPDAKVTEDVKKALEA